MTVTTSTAVCQPRGDSHGIVCTVHGSEWAVAEGTCATTQVLVDVFDERARQFAQYGANRDLEDGTGPFTAWLRPVSYMGGRDLEEALRADYVEHSAAEGKPTWMHLVREEMAEAFKEDDPLRLREELVQVAALAVSWIEKLDERIWR